MSCAPDDVAEVLAGAGTFDRDDVPDDFVAWVREQIECKECTEKHEGT